MKHADLIRGRDPLQVLVSLSIPPLSEHECRGPQVSTKPGSGNRRADGTIVGAIIRFRLQTDLPMEAHMGYGIMNCTRNVCR